MDYTYFARAFFDNPHTLLALNDLLLRAYTFGNKKLGTARPSERFSISLFYNFLSLLLSSLLMLLLLIYYKIHSVLNITQKLPSHHMRNSSKFGMQ